MGIRISAEREIPDARTEIVFRQPHHRFFFAARPHVNPLDQRFECPLGRARLDGLINDAQYDAGCQWRVIYLSWLRSIGAPSPFAAAIDYRNSDLVQDDSDSDSEFTDEQAEALAKAFKAGEQALKKLGRGVFHAVNKLAVYEEPGGYTAEQIRVGLSGLARLFG